MADGGIGEVALAEAAFDTAAFEGLNAASVFGADAATTAATAAGAAGATGAAANSFDPAAFEGISQYMGTQAPVNPISQAINAGNMANITGSAPNAFQGITELTDSQLAEVMQKAGVNPEYLNNYAPTATDAVSTSTLDTTAGPFNPPSTPFAGTETPDLIPGAYGTSTPSSFLNNAASFAKEYKTPLMMAGTSLGLRALMDADSRRYGIPGTEKYTGPLSKFSYNPSNYQPDIVKPPAPYRARYAGGGPVETMSNQDTMGANTMYPMANMRTSAFATPYQTPQSTNMFAPSGGGTVDQMSGEPNMQGTRLAEGGIARLAGGGIFGEISNTLGDIGSGAYQLVQNLGQGRVSLGRPDHGDSYQPDDYSKNSYTYDPNKYKTYTAPNPNTYQAQYAGGGIAQLAVGGKLLRGQGDGMSDSIKANISGKREARLADGEFVVPADVVSHLGNGSTDAGAKQLYSMMDKVRQARVGSKKQGKQINPMKYMPA
jgi:hypothetical protein